MRGGLLLETGVGDGRVVRQQRECAQRYNAVHGKMVELVNFTFQSSQRSPTEDLRAAGSRRGAARGPGSEHPAAGGRPASRVGSRRPSRAWGTVLRVVRVLGVSPTSAEVSKPRLRCGVEHPWATQGPHAGGRREPGRGARLDRRSPGPLRGGVSGNSLVATATLGIHRTRLRPRGIRLSVGWRWT